LLETLHVAPGREVTLPAWCARHRQALRLLGGQSGEIDAQALFEEFRGLIGAQPSGPLSLADYLALGARQGLLNSAQRDLAQALFQRYRDWLAEVGLYDRNLVAHVWRTEHLPANGPVYNRTGRPWTTLPADSGVRDSGSGSVVLDTSQMLGKRLAARLALAGLRLVGFAGILLGLQRSQLSLQIGLVLGQRVLEHLALLSVHRLGLRAELPGLHPGQLERDALDLGVLAQTLASSHKPSTSVH
jgi:hypothetical protein